MSCKTDGNQQMELKDDTLVGEWNILEAYKAKQKTQLLSNTYFEFTADRKVKSNLHPTEEAMDYTMIDNEIKVGSSNRIKYKIERLEADTLELSSKIKRIEFDLVLIKKEK